MKFEKTIRKQSKHCTIHSTMLPCFAAMFAHLIISEQRVKYDYSFTPSWGQRTRS